MAGLGMLIPAITEIGRRVELKFELTEHLASGRFQRVIICVRGDNLHTAHNTTSQLQPPSTLQFHPPRLDLKNLSDAYKIPSVY